MANKISNVPYDQIPHIVLSHPQTKPDHIVIMTYLFKVLKDETNIVYSNEKLSINSKIPLRTVERRISQLNKMGFIACTGLGRSRRISLGLLLINTAQLAVGNSPAAKLNSPPAKSDSSARHTGGHTKPYINPSSNEYFSSNFLKHLEQKEIETCLENNWPLSTEYKYLQQQLEERKNENKY